MAVQLRRVTYGPNAEHAWSQWIRRGLLILTIYAVGLLEGYYLPQYGLEWMLGIMGATAFLAGFWIRKNWN